MFAIRLPGRSSEAIPVCVIRGRCGETVVATLWSIGDSFTVKFMESFYENIFSGQSVGEAMWRTKKEYFKKIQQRSFTDAMMYVAPFIAVTQAVMKPSEQAVIVRRTSPITSVPDRRQEIQMTSAGGSAGYVRDVNGILVWNNKPMANESALWEGQSEDGFASGLGKLTWRKDGLFDVH
jgi:hypothetical protein